MCTIETSESIQEIAGALLRFQSGTHGVVKDSVNPFHKSRYASLEAVIETIREPLARNCIAFLQAPGRVVNGALEVSTMLMHTASGEWIRSTMSLPLAKLDPQGVGSAITYGSRYALMASLGLPALDDDAEAARHQPEQKRAPEPAKERGRPIVPPPPPLPISKPPLTYGEFAGVVEDAYKKTHPTKPSKEVYIENSINRIADFVRDGDAAGLLQWAKTERTKVWPQYEIEPHDEDGDRIVKAYKAGMEKIEKSRATA